MSITINSPAVVDLTWTNLKAIVLTKVMPLQYDDDGTIYTIYAFDGPIAYIAIIWKGDVPGPFQATYSQAQNDADETDFETNYKPTANRSLVPRSSDGRPITLPSLFSANCLLYLTNAGDDSTYGDGDQFAAARTSSGEDTAEASFKDWIHIIGGNIIWSGGAFGDYVTMEIYAPASSVTSNGGGTGNCNLANSPLGTNTLIVPAAGNGAYDVNLTTAVPIPAVNEETGVQSGYWTWSEPDTGKGTVTATGSGSRWNLFNVQVTLSRFMNKFPLIGAGSTSVTVPAIKTRKVLPHWVVKFTLHNEGGLHTVVAAVNLTAARTKTA